MKKSIKRQIILPVSLGASLLLPSASALADASPWKDGEHVFAKVCSHCHLQGNGPEIMGRQLPAEYIQHTVRHGLRAMPAFRATYISDFGLNAVAKYVSNSKSPARKAKE